MRNLLEVLNLIIRGIMYIFVPLLLINGIIYFIGAFIALDANPFHWLLFTTIPGRVVYGILNLLVIVNSPEFWDSIDF